MLLKNKPLCSKRYRTWISDQPCMISVGPSIPHHWRDYWTDGSMSKKPSDIYAIPLSPFYHTDGPQAIHRVGIETFLQIHDLTRENIMITCLDLIRMFLAEGNKF